MQVFWFEILIHCEILVIVVMLHAALCVLVLAVVARAVLYLDYPALPI